jgi:hypothetical protein
MKKLMLAMLLITIFVVSAFSAVAYNSVDAAVVEELAVGKAVDMQIGAMVYDTTLLGIYDNKEAKFQVNGEVTEPIAMGEWVILADFSELGVIKMDNDIAVFYIDPVGRVSNLNDVRYPMTVSGEGVFNLEDISYTVSVKKIDRGGAFFEVNGELVTLRNPKEATNFYETHFPIDDRAMLSLWHIVRFNEQLYVDISIEPQLPNMPEHVEVVETVPEIPRIEIAEPEHRLDMDREVIIGYQNCMRAYDEDARSPEFRQNYPEAERIRREGLILCGKKYGMPIPPEEEPQEEFNQCVIEHRSEISEGDFERLPPEEQTRIKQTIIERCGQYRPESPRIHPEYDKCREELEAFKRMLVEKYDRDGLSVPEELMLKYEEMGNRCRILQGWEVPEPAESMPERPVPELPEEVIERPYRICDNGCSWEGRCLPIGTRLVKENGHQTPLFCGVRNNLEEQKQLNEQCQNNYECTSNTCQDGRCQSIGERIEGIEKELKEQRTILEKIANFFGRIFGRG